METKIHITILHPPLADKQVKIELHFDSSRLDGDSQLHQGRAWSARARSALHVDPDRGGIQPHVGTTPVPRVSSGTIEYTAMKQADTKQRQPWPNPGSSRARLEPSALGNLRALSP